MEFVCFVWISEQTANFASLNLKRLFFFKPRWSVFTARYTQSLYTRWSKSLCTPDDYNPHTIDVLEMANRIHFESGPCYTEHGLWDHSLACQ